jgi:hypothetical protein
VGEDAHVQRIAVLAADVVPDLGEQVTGGLALTSVVVQVDALADAGDRRVDGRSSRQSTRRTPDAPVISSAMDLIER